VAGSLAEPDPAVVTALRAAGCVYAEQEAALLEEESRDGRDLPMMLTRRLSGEPLEQVLGWAEFCGLRIELTPGVFVPRKRTEELVELAVKLASTLEDPPVVVDLCCGTGAIGVAVASSVPGTALHAADIDPDAVACARLNVTGGQVHEGDLYDALPTGLRGRVDLLLVNAPYVPTDEIRLMPAEARQHEHHVALDGGVDGVEIHRRVAAGASQWLAPGGSLLIETSRHQATDTALACESAGLQAEVFGPDDQGVTVVRAISGPWHSSGTMTR